MKMLPTYWKITPVGKKNNKTEMIIEEVEYDSDISEQYFKKSVLKHFSR